MNRAGCVFKFLVLSPEVQDLVDTTTHRKVLIKLHEMLTRDALDWHGDLIKDKRYEDFPEPFITWELEDAVATPLSSDEVFKLTLTNDTSVFERLALYAAFIKPPYRARFKKGETEAKAVFHEWCDLLGLNTADDVTVLNWVDSFCTGLHENGDAASDVEPWSSYFYPGLEWWGVWCLTIWNPKRRTLAALIASTTD